MNLPKPYPKKRYKRKSNPDTRTLGISSLVPYLQNESWQDRHAKRKQFALLHNKKVMDWCIKHKWKMEIKNLGHHWIFTTEQNKAIEWFPSSGKLVIDKKWNRGIHCHEYVQLLEMFEKIIKKR